MEKGCPVSRPGTPPMPVISLGCCFGRSREFEPTGSGVLPSSVDHSETQAVWSKVVYFLATVRTYQDL